MARIMMSAVVPYVCFLMMLLFVVRMTILEVCRMLLMVRMPRVPAIVFGLVPSIVPSLVSCQAPDSVSIKPSPHINPSANDTKVRTANADTKIKH